MGGEEGGWPVAAYGVDDEGDAREVCSVSYSFETGLMDICGCGANWCAGLLRMLVTGVLRTLWSKSRAMNCNFYVMC